VPENVEQPPEEDQVDGKEGVEAIAKEIVNSLVDQVAGKNSCTYGCLPLVQQVW
jgi:hypothetical protein